MTENGPVGLDVVIFGGGAAGLWLLDDLIRGGYDVLLLEAGDLGSGQTITSQGIIHGGLKYTLTGLFNRSAAAVREMPLLWRKCLAGDAEPSLRRTRLRSPFCHLWQTSSLTSKAAMIGARAGLRVAPVKLEADQRPVALANCPGVVARLDEQVIEPSTFLNDLGDRHRARIMKIDARNGLEFETAGPGAVDLIRLINPETGEPLDLAPRRVILTAGEGNQELCRLLGLAKAVMQRRPLHMVMLRGSLPPLNGHCVDGMTTRLTVSSTSDCAGRTVWQLGGQLAENGVKLRPLELIEHARTELAEVLPDLDQRNLEWATYRVDRAEPATKSGMRPDDAHARRKGNTIIGWPTKLALAPRLAQQTGALLRLKPSRPRPADGRIAHWPRPDVALPPWEIEQQWYVDH